MHDRNTEDPDAIDPAERLQEDVDDGEVVMRDLALAIVERVDTPPPLRAAWDGDGATIEQILPASPATTIDFDSFYLKHQPLLLRKMLKLCAGDRHLAEDITQQTLLVAYRIRERLSEVDDHGAWLYTVASRAAWKIFERRRMEEELLRTTAARPARPREPHDWALPDDLLRRVLTVRQRRIIIYRFIHEQQIKWIADQLGLSQRTINNEIRRSLDKLRPYFDPSQEDN